MIFFRTNALNNYYMKFRTRQKTLIRLYTYNQLTTCEESLISAVDHVPILFNNVYMT